MLRQDKSRYDGCAKNCFHGGLPQGALKIYPALTAYHIV
jgi:hypothetical protein